jgi:hypothetical protein
MSLTVVPTPAKRRRVDGHHYVSAADDFEAFSLTHSQEQSCRSARSNVLASELVRTPTICSPRAGISPIWKQDGRSLSPISDAINDHNEAIAPNGNTPSCKYRMVRDTINRVKRDEDLGRHDESGRQELYNVGESEICFGMVGGPMTLQQCS